MTKKRWLLVTACVASLVGVPILVIALLPPRPGITKANYDRVQNRAFFDGDENDTGALE